MVYIDHNTNRLYTQRSEFFPEPTAHEAWVRNRIPRGAHYDTADDGPETDTKFMLRVAAVIKVVTDAMLYEVFNAHWLNCYKYDFGGLDFDTLTHGRE